MWKQSTTVFKTFCWTRFVWFQLWNFKMISGRKSCLRRIVSANSQQDVTLIGWTFPGKQLYNFVDHNSSTSFLVCFTEFTIFKKPTQCNSWKTKGNEVWCFVTRFSFIRTNRFWPSVVFLKGFAQFQPQFFLNCSSGFHHVNYTLPHCHKSFNLVFKNTCGTVWVFWLCPLSVSNRRKTCKKMLLVMTWCVMFFSKTFKLQLNLKTSLNCS